MSVVTTVRGLSAGPCPATGHVPWSPVAAAGLAATATALAPARSDVPSFMPSTRRRCRVGDGRCMISPFLRLLLEHAELIRVGLRHESRTLDRRAPRGVSLSGGLVGLEFVVLHAP